MAVDPVSVRPASPGADTSGVTVFRDPYKCRMKLTTRSATDPPGARRSFEKPEARAARAAKSRTALIPTTYFRSNSSLQVSNWVSFWMPTAGDAGAFEVGGRARPTATELRVAASLLPRYLGSFVGYPMTEELDAGCSINSMPR